MRPDTPDLAIKVEGSGRALADGNLVHQILLNLIQNAANVLEGTGSIRVVIEDAQVKVEDSGPGVPKELRERIFQPFFTTRTRGTGLGLAICVRGARAMDAKLSLCDSKDLGGACFCLNLQAPPE